MRTTPVRLFVPVNQSRVPLNFETDVMKFSVFSIRRKRPTQQQIARKLQNGKSIFRESPFRGKLCSVPLPPAAKILHP